MELLASDAMNSQFVGATNPDDRLYVQFYDREVQNNYQTRVQGRPIFDMVTFVKIFIPGDQLCVNDRPATEYDKERFPRHWSHFENKRGPEGQEALIGTPLSAWPILQPNQVAELRALKFFTVEQIASASDAQIGKIGMIAGMSATAFRDQALRYLAVAKDAAIVERYVSDSKAKDEQMASMRAEFEKKFAEQEAQIKMMLEANKKANAQPSKAAA